MHTHPDKSTLSNSLEKESITLNPDTEFPVVQTDHSCGLFTYKRENQ